MSGDRISSPSSSDVAFRSLVRIEVVHSVQHPQQRRFAAAGWTDEGCHLVGVERDIDGFQCAIVAVVEIQIADRDLFLEDLVRGQGMANGRYGDGGCHAHDIFSGRQGSGR